MVKFKQRKSHIQGIVWEGRWHSNPNEVKNAFFYHYKKFFKKIHGKRFFSLGTLNKKNISAQESMDTEKHFSREEVVQALN